jgi:hypothetical protein
LLNSTMSVSVESTGNSRMRVESSAVLLSALLLQEKRSARRRMEKSIRIK